MMSKVEFYYNKDHTEVAILISAGFGAGWSSWNTIELAYDKRVVEYWLAHKDDEEWMAAIDKFLENNAIQQQAKNDFAMMGYPNVYFGGFNDIKLIWVPIGTKFRINEYDGAESIYTEDMDNWVVCY